MGRPTLVSIAHPLGAAAIFAGAGLLATGSAHAEGTESAPRAVARASTLPELTHRGTELALDYSVSSIDPHDPTAGRLALHIAQVDCEVPLLAPVFYAGGRWGLAAGHEPGAPGQSFVPGQPQLWARAVHSFSHEQYSVGAGFGASPPLFYYEDTSDTTRLARSETALLASIVRPWDLSMFLDRRLTLRPWIDLRVAVRALVVQVRQGLDVSIRTGQAGCPGGASCERPGETQFVSLTGIYVGWQPLAWLALGVEGWEIYLLKTAPPIEDRDRTAFAVSPTVRFFHRWAEPALSFSFPVGPPLLNAAESYWSLRLDFRVRLQ
jgi:hypothetical protein